MTPEGVLTPYHLETTFDRRATQTPDGRRKAQLFSALVPAGCKSILDAGGGTGWSTMGMRAGRRVVTLDSSAESLAHAPGETVLASVADLPFDAGSFDMVMSSQVLEHLSDDVLQEAVDEMRRVARHWILISTPYREALETRFVRCGACGHAFHPDYHCRSFSERDLAWLLPGWVMAEWHVFGPISHGMGVDPMTSLRPPPRNASLSYAGSTTLCPKCGSVGRDDVGDPQAPRRSLIERVIKGVSHRMRQVFRVPRAEPYPTFLPGAVAPYWIAALFSRAGAPPIDGELPTIQSINTSSGGVPD